MKVIYSSNNSGGRWWLEDEDWKKLESGGWAVEWKEERWFGALATSASIDNVESEDVAIAKWEAITGMDADAIGCTCCGQPHCFYQE